MVVFKKKHIRSCSLLAGGIVAASIFFAGFQGKEQQLLCVSTTGLFALCTSYTHKLKKK